MCGRYAVKKSTLLIANNLVKKNINVDLEQNNFNCSPGGKYPVIKSATNGKYFEMTTWGIKPSLAKEDFRSLHNARLEGIDQKVSFKKLIVNSRAIVPVTGYYEWKKTESKKIPFYFTRQDDKEIFLACIHDNGQFAIITREATQNNSEIHHRQPVILNHADVNRYLNIELQGSAFLNDRKIPNLIFHEVSKEVNKPTNNIASLIQPV